MSDSIDVLDQIFCRCAAHCVEYDIYTFASRQFCSRYKIGIGSYQYNLFDLIFVSHRRYVET